MLEFHQHIEFFLYKESSVEDRYVSTARILKAISDPKRLKIVDMLSCGELCGCNILEYFKISQPTLSHDMKVLVQSGIVYERRSGKNIFYSLNNDKLKEFQESILNITTSTPDCICHQQNGESASSDVCSGVSSDVNAESMEDSKANCIESSDLLKKDSADASTSAASSASAANKDSFAIKSNTPLAKKALSLDASVKAQTKKCCSSGCC